MATQAIESVPSAEADESSTAAEAPKAPGKRKVLILAIAGLAAGSAAGLFGIAPVLAKRKTATVETHKTEGKLAEAAVVHSIENLVLNPAGSGGTRFLMVTATFELKDGSIEQQMKDHDAEVRDHILAMLGKKTVEELSDITLRESMKREVLASVAGLFPKDGVRKVFFAQFVIQ
jgi:flagellar FliL protein